MTVLTCSLFVSTSSHSVQRGNTISSQDRDNPLPSTWSRVKFPCSKTAGCGEILVIFRLLMLKTLSTTPALVSRSRLEDRQQIYSRRFSSSPGRFTTMSPTDYDPEDERLVPNESDESEDVASNQGDGREHYEKVGASKLRRQDGPELGARYEGATVSRANFQEEELMQDPFAPVEEDEDEDPFAAAPQDPSDESYSGSESGGSRVTEPRYLETEYATKSTNQTNGNNGITSRDDGGLSDDEHSDDEGTDYDTDMENVSDASEEDEISDFLPQDRRSLASSRHLTDREKMKALQTSDATSVTAALSSAAREEAKKGSAVKQQRECFDRLLDTRIKMQKALTSINQTEPPKAQDDSAEAAISKAEEAVMSLLNTIDEIKCELSNASLKSPTDGSNKRKRPLLAEEATPLDTVWSHIQSQDASAEPHRRSVLDHWSSRTRVTSATSARSNQGPVTEANLTAVIDSYVTTENSKATSEPTATNGDASTSLHYNDDAFYQSLLRDLIASRAQSVSSDLQPVLPTKLHESGSSKKSVDTRASKGRKIRYIVHEKLQNFMAPEDRTTWTDSARREFFGSLFGQSGLLEEVDVSGGVEVDGANEEQALRLFRQ